MERYGQKKYYKLQKERKLFIDGARKNNISEDKAIEIFDFMDHFAMYTFNKSHAFSYTLISYQPAWLKTHYEIEFMDAFYASTNNNENAI